MTDERREFFRVQAFARVSLNILRPKDLDAARMRMRMRHSPQCVDPLRVDESRWASENRGALDLVEHMALTLDRIDRKLDTMMQIGQGNARRPSGMHQAMEITLSGSGVSGPFNLSAKPGTLVEVQIDLWEAKVPMIPAIARIIGDQRTGDEKDTALSFQEILPEDRERIVQFTVRNQAQEIHTQRLGTAE